MRGLRRAVEDMKIDIVVRDGESGTVFTEDVPGNTLEEIYQSILAHKIATGGFPFMPMGQAILNLSYIVSITKAQ